MTDTVKCASCNIVINEVLAFISNKMDVMDEQSIERICVSAFSEDEIVIAKNLLFASIPSRKKTRKRQGKSLRNIEDIICLLKETEPEELPIFVARELQKLPPVLFDHIDVTRLLKDLLVMRNDLNHIAENYATNTQLEALKSDIELLRCKSSEPFTNRKVNTKRGASRMESFEYTSGPMGLTPIEVNPSCPLTLPQNTFEEKDSAVIVSGILPAPSANKSAERQRLNSAVTVAETAESDAVTNKPDECGAHSVTTVQQAHVKSFSETVQDGDWKPQPRDDNWVLVQKKRLRNRFIGKRGIAVDTDSNFKAADIKIPMYIYNVSKDVALADVQKYIEKKSNISVTLEKINTKSPRQYDGYKVFVPRQKIDVFMKDDFWPEGISYRRFVNLGSKRGTKSADVPHLEDKSTYKK